MLKKISIAIAAIAIFAVLMVLAAKADDANCKRLGQELGAKSVLVGTKCMVEGYGRVY